MKKPCILKFPKFPFGRTENISQEAADLATAFDIVMRYPKFAATVAPGIAYIRESAALLLEREKAMGVERLNEELEKNLHIPPAS